MNIALLLQIPIVLDAMLEFKRCVERARRKERKKRLEGKGDVRLARVLALGKYTKDAEEDEVKRSNCDWIASLRVAFTGYMMRRTIHSKDHDDKPISGLAPWYESSLLISLTEDEMECQQQLADSLAEVGVSVDSKAVGVSFHSSSFIGRSCLQPWALGVRLVVSPGDTSMHDLDARGATSCSDVPPGDTSVAAGMHQSAPGCGIRACLVEVRSQACWFALVRCRRSAAVPHLSVGVNWPHTQACLPEAPIQTLGDD